MKNKVLSTFEDDSNTDTPQSTKYIDHRFYYSNLRWFRHFAFVLDKLGDARYAVL